MVAVTASIPVDVQSPGQVLACMGFLEAAEVLLGGVEGHFDWQGVPPVFVLAADGESNAFEAVLDFLARARVVEVTPLRYIEGGTADGDDEGDEAVASVDSDDPHSEASAEAQADVDSTPERITFPAFPSGEGDRYALPAQLVGSDGLRLMLSHWADGSSRDPFKLYSGNRSASRIATQLLHGVRAKRKRRQYVGDFGVLGISQLWQEQRAALLRSPFDVVTPMRGSFNFDPRGTWTAIDAGYSPNTQRDGVAASPLVEMLAAIGLEHARPDKHEASTLRYAIWGHPLPPMLARAALAGANLSVPMRRFAFGLNLSGTNRVTTFAREEAQR